MSARCRQNRLKFMNNSTIENILTRYLHEKTFSGCSVGVGFGGGNGEKENYYQYNSGFTSIFGEHKVTEKTIFDLASLTKPLVTSLCILVLLGRKKIFLSDTLGIFLPHIPRSNKNITIAQLLHHRSGLPHHKPYYLKIDKKWTLKPKAFLLDLVCTEPLIEEPGCKTIYSDLGFILLAAIIEIVTGESLDIFWSREILHPLQLEDELFFPKNAILDVKSCAQTACMESGQLLCGIVHDNNCRQAGGVCGHAGMFGTLHGVLALTTFLLRLFDGLENHPAFTLSAINEALQTSVVEGWWLGFDTPSKGYSASGKYFSVKTIGHLGFTGTSFWMDRKKKISVVVLSNRVIYKENEQLIRTFRPEIHDAIMLPNK